jgi:hypothetical protein
MPFFRHYKKSIPESQSPPPSEKRTGAGRFCCIDAYIRLRNSSRGNTGSRSASVMSAPKRSEKSEKDKFPFFKALLMKIPWPRGFAFENRSRVYIYFFSNGARTAAKMTEAVVFKPPKASFERFLCLKGFPWGGYARRRPKLLCKASREGPGRALKRVSFHFLLCSRRQKPLFSGQTMLTPSYAGHIRRPRSFRACP